jgi:hypothetical protein
MEFKQEVQQQRMEESCILPLSFSDLISKIVYFDFQELIMDMGVLYI